MRFRHQHQIAEPPLGASHVEHSGELLGELLGDMGGGLLLLYQGVPAAVAVDAAAGPVRSKVLAFQASFRIGEVVQQV